MPVSFTIRGVRWIPLLLALGQCAREEALQPPAAAAAALDRDTWWDSATKHRSGRERVLAPRELRALLTEGRRLGFAGGEWWRERTRFVWERVLEVDPDDVEANAGMGRRTLQSIAGFEELWRRMLTTRAPNDAVTELLDRYDAWVREERPVFLSAEEFEVVSARLDEVRRHLHRLETDHAYAALQTGLARVRSSVLADFPSVHLVRGPFVIFFSARDLQPGVEEDESRDAHRLEARREVYRRKLEEHAGVYAAVLEDLAQLYPTLWERYGVDEGTLLYQWIFEDRGWYETYLSRAGPGDRETPYRCGFFEPATGWAFLYVPEGPPDQAASQLRETAAYLAARQLLRRWAKDPADPLRNPMDRCRAYWLKEGWPSFVAARRVERPQVGRRLEDAAANHMLFPPIERVLDRESRLELRRYEEPPPEFEEHEEIRAPLLVRDAFSDLAWLLVRHLNAEERRPAFERFLLSQLAGTRHGRAWFEECFGIEGYEGLRVLERAVYAPYAK